MSKLIRAVDAAQAVSEQFGIPLADLVDVFAETPSQETELVKRPIGSQDPKKTESEIMNALECCAKNPPSCADCNYKGKCNRRDCYDYLKLDALDLINRKNAENKRLQAKNKDILIIRGEGEKVQDHIQVGEITYCEHCGQALDWRENE